MAPVARKARFVHTNREKEEESSDEEPVEEEEREQDETDEDDEEDEEEEEAIKESTRSSFEKDEKSAKEKKKEPITISLKKVCKVCKRTGHEAGFKGAIYIDCPMKPCFLCKKPGHTTMTCPHRVTMEHGVIPAQKRNTRTSLDYLFQRELKAKLPCMVKPKYVIPNQLECGNVRFHIRRITCLEFHPTNDNVILSGDKKGALGIWDYVKLHEKTVYDSIHNCIVNNIKFDLKNEDKVYMASSDGTVSYTDIVTGISSSLLDLNPNGWNGPNTWHMIYGMDLSNEKGLVLVADNFGYLYMVDKCSNKMIGKPILLHKKGSKITGLHFNPARPDLLLSCGNDHFARIWDVRRLESGSSLADLAHGRVVNSAYFSLASGTKILTTCQDNRIRVWDSIFGNLESPSREIVHSHDFNRHLTPFRAEWDPKDETETVAVIGRYISENFDGIALHPIDIIDTATGSLLAEITDPDITTISPVNKLHPRADILVTGSSRSVFVWKPRVDTEEPQSEQLKRKQREFIYGSGNGRKSNGKGPYNDSSDDDNDFGKGGKKKKVTKKVGTKFTHNTTKVKGKSK
ncbi:DNA damage-binding protein 2 [Rhynchospora pubera]|uniref:DNA damage-binding protein 2 n=1 Tax=Rhynchospora pubera TaxID=906938 RepID=A0AAV8EM28_9POAL|nr:DNA damage-binding protein 2 [Rhynchospora pubera]